MNIYDFTAKDMSGQDVNLSEYKDKVLLIVNTASKCGFTPQFAGLELLHKQFNEQGLVILGFPCNQFGKQDPGTNDEILEFCQLNYGVSFTMMEKIDVNGENRHPIYDYLIENSPKKKGLDIKWNFEKFLIGKDGELISRLSSITTPKKIGKQLEKYFN